MRAEIDRKVNVSPLLLPVWKCRECGCLWRDNLDDTVSLLDAEQKSCTACEASTPSACEIHWLSLQRATRGDDSRHRLQALRNRVRGIAESSSMPMSKEHREVLLEIVKWSEQDAPPAYDPGLMVPGLLLGTRATEPIAERALKGDDRCRCGHFLAEHEYCDKACFKCDCARFTFPKTDVERATGGETPPQGQPCQYCGVIGCQIEGEHRGVDVPAHKLVIRQAKPRPARLHDDECEPEPVAEGAAIRQLIERWRSHVMVGSQCADELEALLSSSPTTGDAV